MTMKILLTIAPLEPEFQVLRFLLFDFVAFDKKDGQSKLAEMNEEALDEVRNKK